MNKFKNWAKGICMRHPIISGIAIINLGITIIGLFANYISS